MKMTIEGFREVCCSLRIRHIVILLCFLFADIVPANAQFVLPKKKKKESADTLKLKEHFAFRTNAVEWFALMPNIAIEYDLGRTNYNHWTIGLSGRYNWDTKPEFKSYDVYNLAEGKLELRNYWHTRTRNGSYNNLLNYLTSRERKNPRYWRAYYLGGYVAGGLFSMKFSENGYQGKEINAGISFGAILPMYTYKGSMLDIELGASVGGVYVDCDKYRLDRETNCYVTTGSKKGFVQYPLVTDLRAAIVYRFGHSVKNKYKYNQAKHLSEEEARAIHQKLMQAKQDSINKVRETERKVKLAAKAEKAMNDSIAKAKTKADKAAKAEQAAASKAAVKAQKAANDSVAKAKAVNDKKAKADKAAAASKAKADVTANAKAEKAEAAAKAKAEKALAEEKAKAEKTAAKANAKKAKAEKTEVAPTPATTAETSKNQDKTVKAEKAKKVKLTQEQKDSIALFKKAEKLGKAEKAAKAKADKEAAKFDAKVSARAEGDKTADSSEYADKIAKAAKADKAAKKKAAKEAKSQAEQDEYENKEILKRQAEEEAEKAKAEQKANKE